MMELETPNDFDYLDNLTLAKADNSTQTIGLDEGFFDFKVAVKEESLERRMLMSGCMPWYQNGVVSEDQTSPPISPDSTTSYHGAPGQHWMPNSSGYMMLVPQSPSMASIIIPSSPTISSSVQDQLVGYLDENKKCYPKPVYSYSCLIAMALKQSKDNRLPVSEIYQFMQTEFPYFRTAPEGWKNSVRHNLSLNKAFYKLERPEGSSHKKGCYWMLNPEKVPGMDREIEKWKRKHPEAIQSSMLHPEDFWEASAGPTPTPPVTKTQRFQPYSTPHTKRYSSETPQFTPADEKENTPLNCYPESEGMWQEDNPAMFSTMLEPSPNYPSVAVRYQV